MTVTRLFAGTNTAKGFYSFFPYLAQDSFRRVYILKGGPGTGKSTFLQKIIDQFPTAKIDRYHCSSEPDSLDGIYIHGLDISLLDGTAPHTVEPHLPGAVQQIVNLGQCWDNLGLARHRKEILELRNAVTRQYKIAYKWLALAGEQAELVQDLEKKPIAESQAVNDAQKIAKLLPTGSSGQNRRAFATAITGSGLVNFLPELQKQTPIAIGLAGGNRAYNNKVLQVIKDLLLAREIPATYLYCGLQPENLEHIFIPDSFGIFSQHRPHDSGTLEIVFGLEEPPTTLENELSETLGRSITALAQARQLHTELEKIYVSHVDFTCVERQREMILKEILQLKTR